jgi:hypothetical protein
MADLGRAASDASAELTILDTAQDKVNSCRIYSKDCQVEVRYRDRARESVKTRLTTLDMAYRHADSMCRADAPANRLKPPSK